jgi:tRNA pseudouridine55 synthase
VHGALLLDKPVGITSNFALQKARKLLGARKAGHAGTLDPLASGLLVVLFGEATKFAGPLLDQDKEYVATLKLGERTDTADAEGRVIETGPVPADAEARIAGVLAGFVGEIAQIPPMYSALKRDGIPLYERARRGETVERAPRQVTIRAIEAPRWSPPLLEFRVRCSKGTYIRTLAEDIGAALGSVAHLTSLRRTRSGGFTIEQAVSLDALEAMGEADRPRRILPLAGLLSGLPRAVLDGAGESRFRNGQALPYSGQEGLCGVYGAGGEVIGLGRADASGHLHPVRLVAHPGALPAVHPAASG